MININADVLKEIQINNLQMEDDTASKDLNLRDKPRQSKINSKDPAR